MRILVINCGSSSVKVSVFDGDTGLRENDVDRQPDVEMTMNEALKAMPLDGLQAVGHRIVHGGLRIQQTRKVDPEVKEAIRLGTELAPLHNEFAFEVLEECEQRFSGVPQYAVFDSSFHATIPARAAAYGLPVSYFEEGYRKFGFHGASHQYASQVVAERLGRPLEELKMITCHLGNGASVCAVLGGKSVDTSMGFTPDEGLLMGTRAGDIDSGLLIYLMKGRGWSVDRLRTLLLLESGLKGLSGIDKDMRKVEEAARSGDPHAVLAVDVFCYRVKKYIGAYFAVLNGLDVLVFMGGIGEHSETVRKKCTEGLEALGIREGGVPVMVVRAEEDLMIAREVLRILKG
jgi:acetate kinase